VYSLVGELRRQLVLDELHVLRLRCWARQRRGSRVGQRGLRRHPIVHAEKKKKFFLFFFFFFKTTFFLGGRGGGGGIF
jgi:hypothetical protein